jgi:hypothetical protein
MKHRTMHLLLWCWLIVATLLFLLPEIIMDVLLGMVLFGLVKVAFLTMVVSTVRMSLYVVVQSL